MALQGHAPFIQLIDANGAPIVGAKLHVYEAETTSYRAIYSDDGLSTPLSNPLTGVNASDATGKFPLFYMAAGLYKLRAETSAGVLIWEYDNLDTGTSAGAGALPIANGGTGATSASGARANLDVPSNSELSDLAAQIAALTNSLTAVSGFPQGRLTLTSNTPVLASTVSAATSVYYTPYTGNQVPVYDGSQFNLEVFAELTLSLVSNHTASNIFDVFAIKDNGTIRLVTGPAWSTPTAGAGARGTGAGTTELTRLNGILVNAAAMATARNGGTTYSVPANQGTYLGSIFMDGTNGQITCHTAYGQSRKWSVWNYYNRVPIVLKAGDATASWTYNVNTIRSSNNAAANKLTIFSGMAEEAYDLQFIQSILTNGAGAVVPAIGIGYNSTSAQSGKIGKASSPNGNAITVDAVASYLAAPALGIEDISALETNQSSGGASTFYGTEAGMVLSARWRG